MKQAEAAIGTPSETAGRMAGRDSAGVSTMGYSRVRDLARSCRISSDVIRYYTRIGLLRPRRDPGNNYRLYSERDAQRLRFINRAKSLGYTLAEIRQILRHSEAGDSPCPLVREIIQRRIVENRERIRRELALQERMERALAQWADMPDGIPDGTGVCRLIEALDLPPEAAEAMNEFEGAQDE